MESQIFTIFLALVVLVNPFAALSLFLDITKDATRSQARKVAFISAMTVFITVAVFTVAGEPILKLLGISLGSFRIAGGILVLLIAIGMMNGAGNVAKPSVGKSQDLDGAVFQGAASAVVPLTIPMVIGPGGISTVIIYAASGHSYANMVALILAGFIISIITYLSFMAAGQVSKFLGETGLNVLNRVMGMLLAAVAVEIFVSGLRSLFPQLA
ncbi:MULTISPECIES: MarC family protein [unclassified Moraxella]|uniref:MarC family protein n=1 Tax=unclassified Moraxella TaxID=2685852 RepID=UPI003AF6260C